jgi:FMN reductase
MSGPPVVQHLRTITSPGRRPLSLNKAIEEADALVVLTPVYKGSYTGLLKHLFDFIDPAVLGGRPIVLTAIGGGQKHALPRLADGHLC